MRRFAGSIGLVLALVAVQLPGVAQGARLPKPPGISENDPDYQAGFVNVLLYDGVDNTGTRDSTAGLQQAIDDGIHYALAVYIPAGVYLVSDTLRGEQPNSDGPGQPGCEDWIHGFGFTWSKAPSLVGPASGPRPLIKLADESPGFCDPSDPKSVIHFRNMDGKHDHLWRGSSACGFYFVLSNVDVEVGSGNPGAIGVQFPSAQYSYIENVTIKAAGGYAGLRGTSNDNVTVNLEVQGGRYGVIPGNWGAHTFVGLKLKNQTSAGLYDASGAGATTIIGFEIVSNRGAAIQLAGGNVSSSLSMLDGLIRAQGATLAVNNGAGRNLYIGNTFYFGSAAFIKSGSNAAILPDGGGASWHRVSEYSHTDTHERTTCNDDNSSCATQTSHNMVQGVLGQDERASVDSHGSEPPGDLLSRHLPGSLPFFRDPGVVNVKDLGVVGDGVTDDTVRLQKALKDHDVLFLPRGDYLISATLQLRASTKLFGVPGARSRIRATDWNPEGEYLPLVRTVNDPDATTYIGDVKFVLPAELEQTFLSALDWQAGRNSVVRHVDPGMAWGQRDSQGRKLVHVRNHGGGRIYGLMLHLGNATTHPEFRSFLAEGTREPLTIYSPNPEHTRANATNMEFIDVQNARILGAKTESCGYGTGATCSSFLWIKSSSNVMVLGNINHTIDGTDGSVRLEDSDNILLGNVSNYLHHWWRDSKYMVKDMEGGNTVASIPQTSQCSLFRKGTFDPTAFEVESVPAVCGERGCESSGGEDCESCPQDCGPCPQPQTIDACRLSSSAVVDGDAQEWLEDGFTEVPSGRSVILPHAPDPASDDADCSATVRSAWDATHLYVLVEVRDDHSHLDSTTLWQDDGIELYLDGLYERSESYDANDFQITVASDGRDSGEASYTSAVAVSEAGYVVELAVPWAALGGVVASERILGFDVAINDDDDGGDSRETQLVWNGDGTGWRDPRQFGVLQLSSTACVSCAQDAADCNGDPADGCEVDVLTSADHCGACDRSCNPGSVCEQGRCSLTCSAPRNECDGGCFDVQIDPSHCGGCGVVCPAAASATPVCIEGECSTTCLQGWHDCNDDPTDGCEQSATCVVDADFLGGCSATAPAGISGLTLLLCLLRGRRRRGLMSRAR